MTKQRMCGLVPLGDPPPFPPAPQRPPQRLPPSPTPAPAETCHKLNADQTVAVATDVFWNEDMTTCPRGAKVQLLGAGGVAVYGDYHGDPFWVGWCPLPKRRKP